MKNPHLVSETRSGSPGTPPIDPPEIDSPHVLSSSLPMSNTQLAALLSDAFRDLNTLRRDLSITGNDLIRPPCLYPNYGNNIWPKFCDLYADYR